MEGKKMKKKIILLLCFVMLTVILIGCSSVDEAEIEKMTEVANHIASDEKGYEVPEEYKAEYVDRNVNRRICIEKKIKSEKIKATFDISGQEPTLIKSERYNFVLRIAAFIIIGDVAFTGTVAFCVWLKNR